MIDKIPVSPESRNVISDIDKFDHLCGFCLPEIDGATVTLLLGNDNYLI